MQASLRLPATARRTALAALAVLTATGLEAFTAPAVPRPFTRPVQVQSPARASPSSSLSAVCLVGLAGAAAVLAGRGRGPTGLTGLRALAEVGSVKLNLIGGKATPAPPVGPALGGFGVNIAMFVKTYNALTADKVGSACPVVVHIMSDKSFTLELKTPPTAALLHKAAGVPQGSGKAKINIVGTITVDQLREVAAIKLPDLNCQDVTRAMKICHGTAVATGVKVDGYEEWLATLFPKAKTILGRYGPGKDKLPAPWGDGPALEANA